MADTNPRNWMWSEACEMLVHAERMHRQFFQPPQGGSPAWEPPVDVLETEREVLVIVALPGVDPDKIEAAIDDGALPSAAAACCPSSSGRP